MVEIPEKGSLVWANLNPTLGHEQSGNRPVLVVSADMFNEATGMIWVVPITTKEKGRPDEISLPEGLPVSGVLLMSQIRSLDHTKRVRSIAGRVPDDFLEEVCGMLKAVLEN